jgi:hypothetical protein
VETQQKMMETCSQNFTGTVLYGTRAQWNAHITAPVLCVMQNGTGASALSLKNKAKSRPKFQTKTKTICDAKLDLNGTQ